MYKSFSVLALLVASLLLLPSGDAFAARKKSTAVNAPAEAKPQKTRSKRTKNEKGAKGVGGGESAEQRDRRLERECKGLPNAGACLGYAQ